MKRLTIKGVCYNEAAFGYSQSFTHEELYNKLREYEDKDEEKEQNTPLTLDQLKQLDNEPVWIMSLPAWLKVHEDCHDISAWFIVKVFNKHIDLSVMGFPWLWNEQNYN
jgi:hypothetical protein